MAEESDADEEPVDGDGEPAGADGGSADADGDPAHADSVDSETADDSETQAEPADDGEVDAGKTDVEPGDDGEADAETVDDSDADAGTDDDSETGDRETDEPVAAVEPAEKKTTTDGDESDPIGAVTDAAAPPDESAPGAADGEADDAAGESEETDADDGSTTFDAGEARESGEWATDIAASSEQYEEPVDLSETDDGAGGAAEDTTKPRPGGGGPTSSPITEEEGEFDDVREGPPDDQEMPLADHIEEMVLRLAVVSAVATLVAGTVFFFEPLAENVIMFIWDSVIPAPDVADVPSAVAGTAWPGHYVAANIAPSNPRVYGPLELKLTELKFAGLVGFVVALPVFVYETYRFMRPGLYPHERRYYLAAVPTSLVLAFVGVSFAYFIILPAIFAYFVQYSERAGLLAFALRQTFDLILVLMGYMALVFQIPLFIMLAIMMGLTDRRWLEDRRLYFWGGFLGVSFLFVPEPTGMAPILVALTMIGLFEGTLALLRWTGN